jgi:starch-binding outer membrane protein, SusD/RagB family
MKRNIQIRLFTLASLLFMVSACNSDFFDLTNPPEFPWQNVNQLEMAAVTPYNTTFNSSWGSYWQSNELIFDCMSDFIYLLPNTAADIPYSEMYYRTTEVRIGNTAFGDIYKTIGACNSALDFYAENDDIPFPNPTENDLANLQRIKGELHFMKAFAYFIAAKNFARHLLHPTFQHLRFCH